MANKKRQYIKQSDIKKHLKDSDFLLVLGERSNGKSYSSKNLIIKECWKNNKEFIYLRRYDLDVKDSLCVGYFGDCPIETMTGGEYTCVDVWRKSIYLSNIDENGKVKHGQKIGYCHSLSGAEHYKSLAFPDVNYIIYEEVVSQDGRYLFNEPSKLQQYVSTIFRHRKGKVILIGNTISRICPYYNEWDLKVAKQKLGTVEDYVFHNDNGDDTRLKVYLTDTLNYNTGMFFGLPAKNITKGAYDVTEQPHLPKPLSKYKSLYNVVVEYYEFKFLCTLFMDKEQSDNIIWYVQPKTTDIKPGTRVISNKFYSNPLVTRSFRNPLSPTEQRIFNYIYTNKVCFSDNLTGTEWNNIIGYMR